MSVVTADELALPNQDAIPTVADEHQESKKLKRRVAREELEQRWAGFANLSGMGGR
jgi:hypothetical protein